MKRRKRIKETTETRATIPRREVLPAPPVKPRLRNVYTTRLVISAERTPSGTRYDFQPGQELPVKIEDKDYLLSLKRKQGSSCCGGAAANDIDYFMEV